MFKKQKNFLFNIPAILLCVMIVFASAFFIKASSGTQVQFTAETIISLSGISDGDLSVRTNSECASLTVSGAVLTITDIPIANNFILKTTSHDNGLKIVPSIGVLDLTLDSGNISANNITQWTLNGSTGTTVAHIVGVANANTWYAVKTDGVLFNTFQSNSSGEVSFTYNGSWSEKVFTIEADETNPTAFSLVSPLNNSSVSNSKPTFSWNACSDPDLSHYQLYIDSILDTDSISSDATSITPTNNLSCGAHTWHIKAIDNAGNSTNSDTFNLIMSCSSGMPAGFSNFPISPNSNNENPKGEFKIIINNNDQSTDSLIVNLKFFAGADTTKMSISNREDFKNAWIIPYQETMEWDLTKNTHDSSSIIHNSKYAVYAKFYTKYGYASEVAAAEIILIDPRLRGNNDMKNENGKMDRNDNVKNRNEDAENFAYGEPRLKSLAEEKNRAKDLKRELEKYYGENRIPVHKKYWHIIVNPYIYGNYPIQAIIQAIRFGGKTVHPNISFSAWQKAMDYIGWIGR